jgi:predicted Zn-dependent protease
MLARLMVMIAILTSSFGLGGCGITLLSWDQEVAMGLSAAPQMTEQFGGQVQDPEIRAYVNEVGQKLLAGVDEPVPEGLPWTFTVLDSQVLNAFALPGGPVYISRGLAMQLKSEAEMAGVLGHEIGHVTARHGNQRISQATIIQAGLGLGTAVVGAADEGTMLKEFGTLAVPALSVGGQVLQLKYGRDEELEADALGVKYMARAGYNPIGQRRVMETLGAASGGAAPPEWLSTHPASQTRIDRIDELLRGEYANTQNNPQFVLNEQAYRTRMLDRLSRLGPPAHTGGQAFLDSSGEGSGPQLWCVHCREQALAAGR